MPTTPSRTSYLLDPQHPSVFQITVRENATAPFYEKRFRLEQVDSEPIYYIDGSVVPFWSRFRVGDVIRVTGSLSYQDYIVPLGNYHNPIFQFRVID